MKNRIRRTTLIIAPILFAFICHSQNQFATTESGKKVLLKPDGTWEYYLESNCGNFEVNTYNFTKNLLPKGKDYNYYFNKALQYVQSNGEKSYDAVANFEEAIKLNPNNGGVYSDLGNCYRGGFKCFEKAKYNYTKAIENGFSRGFVFYNRAICNYELQQLSEMRQDLEMSKKLGWNNDYYHLSGK